MPETPTHEPPVESPAAGSEETVRLTEALDVSRERFQKFQEKYGTLVAQYAGTRGFAWTCEPGGFFIELKKTPIRINVDPSFFFNEGYPDAASLFGVFHEIGHFLDMVIDTKAYDRQFSHEDAQASVHPAYPEALSELYNCLDDVMDNNGVVRRWRGGSDVRSELYKNKLLPHANLREAHGEPQPKHRQFMYALLREAMLPEERCEVDPDVRQAIEEWQSRAQGGAMNALCHVTPEGRASRKPQERFDLIAYTVEPVFQRFFEEDLKNFKPPQKKGDGEEGEAAPGAPFPPDPFAKAAPHSVDPKKILDAVKKALAAKAGKAKSDFEKIHGVEEKDFNAYRKDFLKVEEYVKALSKVFDDVIQRRISYYRRLRKPSRDGVVLDPHKGAIAIAAIKSGNVEPIVMLDFERKERIRQLPDEFEFTVVADGSGSMSGNAKEVMQRRLAVLALEAFADFRERVEKARRGNKPIRMSVKSEVRIFSDEDYPAKELSPTLTHVERVSVHKKLSSLPGGGTQLVPTLARLEDEQLTTATVKKLQSGKLKKVIIVLTDGDIGDAYQEKIAALYARAGIKPMEKEKGSLVIAGIGFDDGRKAEEGFAPNGHYAEHYGQVQEIFRKILAQVLSES